MALFSKKQTDMPRRRQATPTSRVPSDPTFEEHHTFRRNRTLTGSASSKVVSTNESKGDLKSPRVQKHELVRTRRHIGLALFCVIVVAMTLYWLVSQFTAGVVVEAQDVSIHLDPIYASTIEEYLSRQPAERLRFMLNQASLSDYLQNIAPEVSSIKAEGSGGFGKSIFIITLRTPIAGWSVGGRQEYVDSAGVSFARNYYTAPSLQIIDDSGVQASAGQAVASDQFLGFVGRVVGFTKMRGYTVTQIIIPQGTTRQLELHLNKIAYPVKLSVDRPAGEQVEDMDRSIKWFSSNNVTPQYLDVRVSGKAFYR